MRFLLTFLALAAPAVAQDATEQAIKKGIIVAEDTAKPGETVFIQLKGDFPYKITPADTPALRLRDDEGNRVLIIMRAKSPGYKIEVNYRVSHPTDEEVAQTPVVTDPNNASQVKAFKDYIKAHRDDEIFYDSHEIKVGKKPDDGDDNDPVDPPDPPDDDAPIPEPGFRVLILYETSEYEKLDPLHKAVISGLEVRQYLDKTCVKEEDGGEGYRIYDKDQDVSGDYKVWRDAMERRPSEIPWVIISNGKTGYEGKLPLGPAKFIELCKKYEIKELIRTGGRVGLVGTALKSASRFLDAGSTE